MFVDASWPWPKYGQLYARARRGDQELHWDRLGLRATGSGELPVDTTRTSPEEASERILEELRRRGMLSAG